MFYCALCFLLLIPLWILCLLYFCFPMYLTFSSPSSFLLAFRVGLWELGRDWQVQGRRQHPEHFPLLWVVGDVWNRDSLLHLLWSQLGPATFHHGALDLWSIRYFGPLKSAHTPSSWGASPLKVIGPSCWCQSVSWFLCCSFQLTCHFYYKFCVKFPPIHIPRMIILSTIGC